MEIGYIKKREIVEEMKESYLDYAMSVIIARALPDVRDGLKPVHRRILYAMWEAGLRHNVKYSKCAGVVGDVLKKFHPHGDTAVYDALVRMAQNFSLRYPLIDGQGNFGCFTKDTKVRLTDGRSLTFEELVKKTKKGKRNWTFSFNSETQKIEVAEIKNPRLTRKREKIIEVILDNGEKIKCTLDHLFMLRNGSYKKAKDLKPDDSLMPLYTEIYQGNDTNLRGYKTIYQPLENNWIFIHYLSDEWNLKNSIYEKSKGKIRHHLDFNKLNNNPDNILRIQWKDHWRFHKEIASERHKNDPAYVKQIAEGRRKFWAKKENKKLHSQLRAERNRVMWRSPKYRKLWAEARKKKWENQEYKEFMRKVSSRNLKNLWKRKDFQELMSKIKSRELKRKWQNEDYRDIMTEWMRKTSLKIWSDPEHREYISKLMKERTQDPNWRKRQSQITKALWRDPEYRAKYPVNHFSKMAKKLWEDPKVKELHQEKARQQWENPEFRKKVIKAVKASNHHRLKENPDLMKKLTERAKVSLHKNWQNPSYKEKVIKNKILGFVYSLLNKYKKVTPKIYEQERTYNGVPKLENALNYFGGFSEIVAESKRYNHRIISTRILREREDVYDLTIEPYHNFCLDVGVFVHNSMDGDSAAAYRYTEARLAQLAEEMLLDIDKETVNWADNYDGTRKEPIVLPAKLPQLLLNGSMGIAVGMTTNIPPHNLGELIDGIIFLIDHPKVTTEDLCQFIKGPDFPTGGFIYDRQAIIQAYSAGKGPIVSRAKTEITEKKAGQFQILISEMTYGVNKANLIEKMANLVKEKKVEGVKDIRDESDKEGVRVVIDLKTDAHPQKILNRLFKLTDLQKTFHLNMLALVDGLQPQVLSLKAVLEYYIKHRQEVVIRRAKFELEKAKERAHILEGLSKALDHIDAVIRLIKKSSTKEEAHKNLMKKFRLTDRQATAILEMRLQTLAGLEQKKIKDELKEKRKLIKELEELLRSPKKILGLIKKELQDIRERYNNERRTKVYVSPIGQFKEEELVPEEECIIIFTQGGYIKRVKPQTYRAQKRGGRGIIGITPREEDVVRHFISASTHDNILFFTGQGRVFQTKVYEIPEGSRTARGQAVTNILQMAANEKITAIVSLDSKKPEGQFLLMATKNGTIKKTVAEEFKHVRRSGLIAINLDKEDELKWAKPGSGHDEIILVTKKGQSIRFKEKDIRTMGRSAAGVRGIKLKKEDEVIGMDIIEKDKKQETRGKKNLLILTENGFGKKTDLKYYKTQKRGGSGIKTAKITAKTGEIVVSRSLETDLEDLIAISQKGQVIRTKLKDISILGRATQGVRIMKLDKGDKVASVACI